MGATSTEAATFVDRSKTPWLNAWGFLVSRGLSVVWSECRRSQGERSAIPFRDGCGVCCEHFVPRMRGATAHLCGVSRGAGPKCVAYRATVDTGRPRVPEPGDDVRALTLLAAHADTVDPPRSRPGAYWCQARSFAEPSATTPGSCIARPRRDNRESNQFSCRRFRAHRPRRAAAPRARCGRGLIHG